MFSNVYNITFILIISINVIEDKCYVFFIETCYLIVTVVLTIIINNNDITIIKIYYLTPYEQGITR